MIRGTVTCLILAALLSGGARAARAQDLTDAPALLKQVGETYKSLKSYYFQSVTVLESKSELLWQRIEMPAVSAESRPGKLRVEARSPFTDQWTLSDGQTTWLYMPRQKQYTRKNTAAMSPAATGNTISMGAITTAVGAQISRYEGIADQVKEARTLRDESIEVGNEKVVCAVVEVRYEPRNPSPDVQESPKTYWIDKVRHIVLRETSTAQRKNSPFSGPMQTVQTTTYSAAKVNEPLPDSIFVFTPPEGAQEVLEISLPGMSHADLSGTEAIDFSLKDLAGQEVHLKNLRGKIVLLDFWASWCGPCRAELPHIEKLHRELKDKGLVVLGIDDEAPEKAQDFAKKSDLTFPTLVDVQREVARRYGVEAIPTVVVIGRDGRISGHHTGMRSEDDLRAALKKAGLE